MKYYKKIENVSNVCEKPYTLEEITKNEALRHVAEQNLETMEENVRCFPGVSELLEVAPGVYVGVAAK